MSFFIETVKAQSTDESICEVSTEAYDWNIKLKTNGRSVTYKMDTGAQVNLPLSEVNKLHPMPEILQSSIKLSAYNGSGIKMIGESIFRCFIQR